MKNVENHYTDNYKMRKMTGELKEWRAIPYLYFAKLSIFEVSVFLKLVYIFNVIPVNLYVYL